MAKYRRQKRLKHKKRIKKHADNLSNLYLKRIKKHADNLSNLYFLDAKLESKKEVFLAATILLTLVAIPSIKQLIMPKRLLQS